MQRLGVFFPEFASGRFRISGLRIQAKKRGIAFDIIAPAATPTGPVGARVG